MQAIILAAGMGKRLGERTKDNTKCMVQVNGGRLIDRMLTQLSTRFMYVVSNISVNSNSLPRFKKLLKGRRLVESPTPSVF